MIIWTRQANHWSKDKKFFHGAEVVSIPLTSQQAIPTAWQPNSNELVIVTSRLAAQLLRDHFPAPSWSKILKIATFSQAVAQELSNYQVEFVSAGGVELLLKAKVAGWQKAGQKVVFAGAETPAFPVVDWLQERGCQANQITLYRTVLVEQLSKEQQGYLRQATVVCLASPSAVRAFAQLLEKYCIKNARLRFACIGPTTAAACAKLLGPPLTSETSRLEDLATLSEKVDGGLIS